MKTLETLKKELILNEKLERNFKELAKLKELDSEEQKDFKAVQDKIKNLRTTIRRLEAKIDYSKEEEAVLSLPEEEQEEAWFGLLKNSDFSKDSILRICSMLRSDGIIPVFKSEGISISKSTALEAYKLLCEKGYGCIAQTSAEKLLKVKEKIIKKIKLNEDDIEYAAYLELYDTSEDASISGMCAIKTCDLLTGNLNKKFKETHDWEYRAAYLVDRVSMALYHGGRLASGEKEFIEMYFNRDE